MQLPPPFSGTPTASAARLPNRVDPKPKPAQGVVSPADASRAASLPSPAVKLEPSPSREAPGASAAPAAAGPKSEKKPRLAWGMGLARLESVDKRLSEDGLEAEAGVEDPGQPLPRIPEPEPRPLSPAVPAAEGITSPQSDSGSGAAAASPSKPAAAASPPQVGPAAEAAAVKEELHEDREGLIKDMHHMDAEIEQLGLLLEKLKSEGRAVSDRQAELEAGVERLQQALPPIELPMDSDSSSESECSEPEPEPPAPDPSAQASVGRAPSGAAAGSSQMAVSGSLKSGSLQRRRLGAVASPPAAAACEVSSERRWCDGGPFAAAAAASRRPIEEPMDEDGSNSDDSDSGSEEEEEECPLEVYYSRERVRRQHSELIYAENRERALEAVSRQLPWLPDELRAQIPETLVDPRQMDLDPLYEDPQDLEVSPGGGIFRSTVS